MVIRLVNELFVNDVPELKHQGKLHTVLFISSNQIIGSYNKIVRDFTNRNVIVTKVMKTAESANIDHICVSQAPGPWLNIVLKYWSQKIIDEFRNSDPDRVSPNASLSHQTVGLGSKL